MTVPELLATFGMACLLAAVLGFTVGTRVGRAEIGAKLAETTAQLALTGQDAARMQVLMLRVSQEVGGVCHARVWRAVAVMDSTSQESE